MKCNLYVFTRRRPVPSLCVYRFPIKRTQICITFLHNLLCGTMLLNPIIRASSSKPFRLVRYASTTHAQGLQAILKKKPTDVVITFAARTAMGRYKKGQLKDHPVDEVLHALFKVCKLFDDELLTYNHLCTRFIGNSREDRLRPSQSRRYLRWYATSIAPFNNILISRCIGTKEHVILPHRSISRALQQSQQAYRYTCPSQRSIGYAPPD